MIFPLQIPREKSILLLHHGSILNQSLAQELEILHCLEYQKKLCFYGGFFARLKEFPMIRDGLNLLELKEILKPIYTVNIRSFSPGMGGAQGHAIYNQLRTKWDCFVKMLNDIN